MASANSPSDLARIVHKYLVKHGTTHLKKVVLDDLFEVLFTASLKTEEGHAITFHVVYVDPSNPDPDPPKRLRRHRWKCVRLAQSLRLTVENIVKLAEASDSRASSFAIHHTEREGLLIWGMVDQGTTAHQLVTFEVEEGFARPGVFHAAVAGLGHILVGQQLTKIAELRVNTLITSDLDVFQFGPISEFIDNGIEPAVCDLLAKNIDGVSDPPLVRRIIKFQYVRMLSRLLTRIQAYRHGGALLITQERADLHLKYTIDYPRLADALSHLVQYRLARSYYQEKVRKEYVDKSSPVPVELFALHQVASNEIDDTEVEIDAAIWFLSLLTRVDGLVLVDPMLRVKGFGTEITANNPPSAVYLATNPTASMKAQRKIEYEHFGTRHRSMMRYCYAHSGSLGIVVSEDGDVRAVMKVRGRLVVWENMKIQLSEFGERALKQART